MTINKYIFDVEDSISTPISFQAKPRDAQMLLNSLAVYWHDDEGSVQRDGVEVWSGDLVVGNSDFSKFVDELQ